MFVPYASEIWTISYGPKLHEILSFLTKNGFFVAIFDKELTPFWKTIIFQWSKKNYGTPTLVTRLKVAPNMADPISLNENFP